MNEQQKLQSAVNKLRETLGEQEVVDQIKRSHKKIFSEQQRYPNGVYVFCSSPEGGLLIGRKN